MLVYSAPHAGTRPAGGLVGGRRPTAAARAEAGRRAVRPRRERPRNGSRPSRIGLRLARGGGRRRSGRTGALISRTSGFWSLAMSDWHSHRLLDHRDRASGGVRDGARPVGPVGGGTAQSSGPGGHSRDPASSAWLADRLNPRGLLLAIHRPAGRAVFAALRSETGLRGSCCPWWWSRACAWAGYLPIGGAMIGARFGAAGLRTGVGHGLSGHPAAGLRRPAPGRDAMYDSSGSYAVVFLGLIATLRAGRGCAAASPGRTRSGLGAVRAEQGLAPDVAWRRAAARESTLCSSRWSFKDAPAVGRDGRRRSEGIGRPSYCGCACRPAGGRGRRPARSADW